MKVYRNNIFIINHVSELPVKQIGNAWYNPSGHKVALHPQINTVIHTGADFEGYTNIRTGFNIQANSYYRFDGTKKARSRADQNLYAKWTNISAEQASALGRIAIFNIMEGTYTGKDMGERSIVATIDFPSRIDFQIGDYVEFEIANLERTTSIHGGSGMEKFYIYTMPTVKKVASRLSFGKAFQHTVTFYPCQYELATVKMRDVLQDISSGVIYTGYDEFSFYGGANTLMKRIMAVLDERFGHTGVAGKDYWSYQIADSINEDRNTALEKFQFDFSDSNVMEALLKLNDAEGINTKFFINERMIYVGFKRPYIVGVDANNVARDVPFEFAYGKTSHLPIETNHGNLYTITKSNGSASPITRLYAYGAERNLQRFYCSDRIKTGRYVNKLMLPSFEDDGRTDYIDSPEGIARFGIREGTKTFDNIYPSLRFFYYGNLRDVKYCIKLMGSGLESDADGVYDGGTNISKANVTPEQIQRAKEEVDRAAHTSIENEVRVTITVDGVNYSLTVAEADQLINKGSVRIGGVKSGRYHYPIARIQCYRVEELLDGQGNHTGLNYLVESAPPVDLAVFCHATGKVVKCVLYADDGQPVSDEHEAMGMTRSEERQLEADGKIPTHTQDGTDYIVGSCFAVHDADFGCGHTHAGKSYDRLPDSDERAAWFIDADSISIYSDDAHKVIDKDKEIYRNEVSIHQIHYTDDHWITDVYEFTDYHQETFNRQGYSAYCWPRVNKYYPNSQADNIEVNAVVDVGPVLIEDTDLNTSQGQQQQTFDIYMRDMGFKINDQTWFGDKCFLFDTCKISFLDGNLGGYEFEMPAESDQDKLGSIYVPALTPDGQENPDFFTLADNPAQARLAYENGAFWRIVAKRAETEVDRYWVPNVNLNASAGDHVVFLDIFMPDLYIRVAEQRLLKEAKKYLDANDDGDIQYSFDFDKVRMLKQPTFPLQMREGAIMRVIDDDLDVGTVNAQKTLFEDKNGLVTMTSLVKLTATVDEGYEIITRDCDYIEAQQLPQATFSKSTSGRITKYFLTFKRSAEDNSMDFDIESGVSIRLYSAAKVQRHEGGGHTVLEWYCWNYKAAVTEIVSAGINGYRAEIPNLLSLDSHAIHIDPDQPGDSKVYVGYSVRKQTLTPVYDESVLPIGRQIFCVANSLTDFKCNKHYEIEMDILEPDLLVEDTPSKKQMFALVNGLGDGETFYYPDYTAVDITPEGETFKRFRISFDLPQDFSDEKDYYPAFLCASDGVTEAVHVRLWSIVERDDAAMEDLNYVDLAIDTVTIKFHDNTREKDVSLQDGQEPERLRDNLSEMSREVSATVKEESRATAWAQLMDRMTEAEQLQDQTLDFYQSLVDASRKHYLELLNLKNNIFDPDGTCKETFLQIMMLQVGADSMNYQLKYTHYSMNGHTANCKVEQGQSEQTDSTSGKLYRDQFKIGNAEEVLDHYVYTDHPTNGEGGRWYPQERNKTWNLHKILPEGQTTEIYPVYFIALKASLTNPQDCHWVCEPTQHATNELVDAPNTQDRYFYFNWGILAPVTDNDQDQDYGKYTLTETRGNAYMYGDNLICGQISTLAGNSYFDLTHGNFVLSKNGPDGQGQYHEGLTYINGVLTIYGYATDGDINNVLYELGLVDDKADAAVAAAAAAQQAAEAAQQAVDKVTNDGIISKGTEKQELNREFIIIAGNTRDGESADGSYSKAITQANQYGVDHTALDLAFQDLYAAMKIVLGTGNNGKIDGSDINKDTYIGGEINGTHTYHINIPFGANLYEGADPLTLNNSLTQYQTAVGIVQGDKYRLFAMRKNSDGWPVELSELNDQGTLVQTLNDLGTSTPKETNVYSDFTSRGGAKLDLSIHLEGGDIGYITIEGIYLRKFYNIDSAKFNELWKNYYDAEMALLNAISNVIDEKEIGSENLLYVNNYSNNRVYVDGQNDEDRQTIYLTYHSYNQTDGLTRTMLPAGNYVFSAERMDAGAHDYHTHDITLHLYFYCVAGGNSFVHKDVVIPKGKVKDLVIQTTQECYVMLYWETWMAYPGDQPDIEGYIIAKSMQLQRGTKSTTYQEYIQHLTDALHGSTEIAGGLIMANLLMLKNEQGAVKAGMSGLTNNGENVLMWGGGTYQQALDQLNGLLNILPVLITKTGIGSRIGCFEVLSSTSVKVSHPTDSGKYITIDSATGIHVFSGGEEVITICADAVVEPQEFGTYFPSSDTTSTVAKSTTHFTKVLGTFVDQIQEGTYEIGGDTLTSFASTIYVSESNSWSTRFSNGDIYLLNTSTNEKFHFDFWQGSIDGVVSGAKTWQFSGGGTVHLTTGNYQLVAEYNVSFDSRHDSNVSIQVATGRVNITEPERSRIILGNNGLLVSRSGAKYFWINNLSSMSWFDVRIKGLPNLGTGSLGYDGMLYRWSDGSLKIGTGSTT